MAGAIAHIKYPIVVNDAFVEATGFQYQHDHAKIIRDFVKVCPRPE